MSKLRPVKKAPPGASRLLPPAELVSELFGFKFQPAPELKAWVWKTFIEAGGDLLNPDHAHLRDADVEFVWASSGYDKQGRRVAGLTEKIQIIGAPWSKGRQEQQLTEWFGGVPKFLITLDGFYCAECSDLEFCALVEHELYHIAQAVDEFGVPAFTRDGEPKLMMRGHDVEEFVGVVGRYGVGDAGTPLAQMIIAAAKGATVAPIKIAQACGTCLLRAA